MPTLKSRLVPRLCKIRRQLPDSHGLTPAAVLVPLFRKEGAWHLLLTARSGRVRHHKNQISFPGGMFHSRDPDLLATALRETEEEVGIKAGDIEVWGQLQETPTPTRFLITPYVGTFPYPYTFSPNADEIEKILEIPVTHFIESRPAIQKMKFLGEVHEIPFYRTCDHWIWGATGRILRQLTSLLKD